MIRGLERRLVGARGHLVSLNAVAARALGRRLQIGHGAVVVACLLYTSIVVINLTHGTGSEVNRFAVASITKLNYKPAIAYDCIYPLFSIDDPALMTKLSPKQTRYVSIDAVNHVVEAATTTVANPLAILLAEETIRLVAKYLPLSLIHI